MSYMFDRACSSSLRFVIAQWYLVNDNGRMAAWLAVKDCEPG